MVIAISEVSFIKVVEGYEPFFGGDDLLSTVLNHLQQIVLVLADYSQADQRTGWKI